MDEIKQYYSNTTARALRYNESKLRYDLIPAIAQREYAKVWTQGAIKYEPRNWEKGMPYSEVIASAMRHLEAIRLGEEIDTETGLLHAAHLMCNAAMLTEFYFTHPECNDIKQLTNDNIEKLAKDYEDSVVYADKGVVYHAFIEGYKKAKNHIVKPELNDLKK